MAEAISGFLLASIQVMFDIFMTLIVLAFLIGILVLIARDMLDL